MLRGRKKRRGAAQAAEQGAQEAAAVSGASVPESGASGQALDTGVQATPTAPLPTGPGNRGKPGKAAKAKKPAMPKGLRRPKGPARQTRMTRLVGLAFCIGGFVAIGFGWSGAANKDCVECQMPYVLSGGAIGIGLIVFGVGMMVMAQLRTEGRRLAERLEQWRSVALSRDSSMPAADGPVPAPAEDQGRPSVEPIPSTEPGPPSVTNRAGSGSPG